MMWVEENITNFMERPYDSMKNPFELYPAIGAAPGSNLDAFTLRIAQGGCKNFVIKIILTSCCELDLTDDEIESVLPQLRALFEIRAL